MNSSTKQAAVKMNLKKELTFLVAKLKARKPLILVGELSGREMGFLSIKRSRKSQNSYTDRLYKGKEDAVGQLRIALLKTIRFQISVVASGEW